MISKKILLPHGAGFIGTNQVNELKPGYNPQMKSEDGFEKSYQWFVENRDMIEKGTKFLHYRITKMIQIQFNTNN